MTKIRCRAQLVAHCQNGTPDDPDAPQHEDGTFISDNGREPRLLGETGLAGTIVCDACYTAIMPFTRSGAALTHEIDEAIEHYRDQAAYIARHADPAELVDRAQAAADGTSYDSPTRRSALACRDLAQAEVDRRNDAGPFCTKCSHYHQGPCLCPECGQPEPCSQPGHS